MSSRQAPLPPHTRNRHQMNVLLLRDPDATKVAATQLKSSKKKSCTGALEFFFFFGLHVCLLFNSGSATYVLGHVACQCWILIVTLLSQSGGEHSQESLSSQKCAVPYCRPTSERGEETDVWTFAVKLSQTLCQRNMGEEEERRGRGRRRKKNPQTLLATICRLLCCSEKS